MRKKTIGCVLFLLWVGILSLQAQGLKFRVVSFGEDPFDLSARSEQYQEVDGSGSLYAIIKVISETPDDDVSAYQYNFGMMNHNVKQHGSEVWVYVQKNAKTVTLSRSGYQTINRYDLGTTIEAGKTYKMVLSAQGPVVRTQMVLFQVSPADSKAVVMVQKEDGSGQKKMFGTIDETGGVAKSLEFGTYTYEVVAENYHGSEGRFTLNNEADTHREDVKLRMNGARITLTVASEADIYVNGTKRGTRQWSGLLEAGNYQVECRQTNHRPSIQTIAVAEGNNQTITLTPPIPITGTLSVTSRPLGASIKIDGRDYGTTPRNITELLIGRHTVTISREGYQSKNETCEIREDETAMLDITMEKTVVNTPVANNSNGAESRTFTVNGVSFVMKRVEGGTFQMGATSEQGSEARSDEKPVHRVTLSDYYIGETEVTQALWQAVMGSLPSSISSSSYDIKGAQRPVCYVSWEDCQEFIRKLNSLTGQRFRLPTEAEWEFAARGGKKSSGYKYSGSYDEDAVAWYSHLINTNDKGSHNVKAKAANELGLYDMSGNVYEWCQDWYGWYSSSAQSNPTGPATGSNRVDRGGNWSGYAEYCRVSYRHDQSPSSRYSGLGLRLAL